MGNEKLIFKLEDNLNETLTPIESVFVLRNIECNMEDDLLKIDHYLFDTTLDQGESWDSEALNEPYNNKKQSHDDFVNIKDEAYKERMCKLLRMTYKKPSPIAIEKVEVTRYTVGPGESYTKVMIVEMKEMPRTIRHDKSLVDEGNGHIGTCTKNNVAAARGKTNEVVLAHGDTKFANGSQDGTRSKNMYLRSYRANLKGVFF
uniref:Uncharacterized protein n=1 Tax=Tanacetum cinerariifolium TaxID=118510 RepID=A0A699GY28_TANCI|nr:hypothetical protein [Tanacetum cinerariifolium]